MFFKQTIALFKAHVTNVVSYILSPPEKNTSQTVQPNEKVEYNEPKANPQVSKFMNGSYQSNTRQRGVMNMLLTLMSIKKKAKKNILASARAKYL